MSETKKIDEDEEDEDIEDDSDSRSKNLFVKRTVKNFIRAQECHASKSLLKSGALNSAIEKMLEGAINRAKANGRKTIMAHDL